jgi:probable phosphoglycerate mutase
MSARVHLVRHAHTDAVDRILAGRSPGWELNAAGERAAAWVGQQFSGVGVRAILTSPQVRARQTADAIAAVTGVAPRVDPELDEIDCGEWTGLSFDVLAADPRWQLWNAHRSGACCPRGEGMAAVQLRAMAAMARAAEGWPDGDVVLVSHADVVKAIVAGVLRMSLDDLARFEVAPASVSVVVVCAGESRVVALNYTARSERGPT